MRIIKTRTERGRPGTEAKSLKPSVFFPVRMRGGKGAGEGKFSPWMVIDEFYQRACHVTLGSNVIKLRLADVFFLPFPRPLFPAHAHEEKYGWLRKFPRAHAR